MTDRAHPTKWRIVKGDDRMLNGDRWLAIAPVSARADVTDPRFEFRAWRPTYAEALRYVQRFTR